MRCTLVPILAANPPFVSSLDSMNGHMIKFEIFEDKNNKHQCHSNNVGTFVVSISHFMRAYFNYQSLLRGADFTLPSDAGYLNVSAHSFYSRIIDLPTLLFRHHSHTLARHHSASYSNKLPTPNKNYTPKSDALNEKHTPPPNSEFTSTPTNNAPSILTMARQRPSASCC